MQARTKDNQNNKKYNVRNNVNNATAINNNNNKGNCHHHRPYL